MNHWMKKIAVTAAASLLALSNTGIMANQDIAVEEGTVTYFNGAVTNAADPHVLYDEESGYYYAYSTAGANKGWMYGIYRSPDLSTWEKAAPGALKGDEENRWGKTWFWAPEVYHNEETGKYFMFYAAMMRDNQREPHFGHADFEEACKVGVAVADNPAGPFETIADHPIDYYPYDPGYHDVNQLMDKKQMLPPSTLEEGETAPLGVYIPFIDPNVFFDDDGRIYLYYSRNAYRNWVWDTDLEKYIEESNIYAVELTTDWWNDPEGKTMPTVTDEYINTNIDEDDPEGTRKDGFVPVISYAGEKQDWENAHVNDYDKYEGKKKNRRWSEGSTTFRKDYDVDGDGDEDPVYYMMYSCNNYENENYGIGYATASSPLGPWKKAESNPILSQDPEKSIYSTGHGSMIESPDKSELFYVYHGRNSTSSGRRMYADRMYIQENALDERGVPTLSIDESTNDQPVAKGVAPLAIQGLNNAMILDVSEVRTVDYNVVSAKGAAFDLTNPHNRLVVEVENPEIADAALEGNRLTVSAKAKGGTRITLRYERLTSSGFWRETVTKTIPVQVRNAAEPDASVELLRLYNPNSGEHFFTASQRERDYLVEKGWMYEGNAWVARAESDRPVYRVYNPNAGDHHYTLDEVEKDRLAELGWKDEGIAWYAEDESGIPVYRSYNPNAKAGAHHFTTSKNEQDYLTGKGWKDEGIAWYGMIADDAVRASQER